MLGWPNDLETKKYFLDEAENDYNKADKALSQFSNLFGKYINLDAKRAQIEWDEFNIEVARARENEIDIELWNTNLKQINKSKLNSKNSFGYKVDNSKLQDSDYMNDLVSKMKQETINGTTSVMSGIIRWVEQHYFGRTQTFTPEQFLEAFTTTAEPTTSKYVLSNLWRDKLQKFQWKVGWKLFKMTLNWQEIYFKDKCTNIVTVVNKTFTTIDFVSSIPIVVTVDTWLDNIYDSNITSSDWQSSIPWFDEEWGAWTWWGNWTLINTGGIR